MWPLVVKGETRGEMVVNPEEAAAIHAQLARMTSDELVGSLNFFFLFLQHFSPRPSDKQNILT